MISDSLEGADILLDLDRTIQSWTQQVDALAEEALEEIQDRDVEQPDFTCEVESGALPVSTSLKALHYGVLKVVFKTLPRMAELTLKNEFEKSIAKIVAGVGAFTLKSLSGAMGQAVQVIIGGVDAAAFQDEMEKQLHQALGCIPSGQEPQPMRYALNEIVRKMKERGKLEPRPLKKVHTRRAGNVRPV